MVRYGVVRCTVLLLICHLRANENHKRYRHTDKQTGRIRAKKGGVCAREEKKEYLNGK